MRKFILQIVSNWKIDEKRKTKKQIYEQHILVEIMRTHFRQIYTQQNKNEHTKLLNYLNLNTNRLGKEIYLM